MNTETILAEASPTSLQDIFDKDPLDLTDDDIERTVTELRSMREKWKATEKKGKPKKDLVVATLEDLGV